MQMQQEQLRHIRTMGQALEHCNRTTIQSQESQQELEQRRIRNQIRRVLQNNRIRHRCQETTLCL